MDLLKNTFPLDGKKLMVCTSQKIHFLSENEAFIEKYVPTTEKKNTFLLDIKVTLGSINI